MAPSENNKEQPKVRVVKGGQQRSRGGVIAVEDKHGKTYYRCSCDRCNQFATLPFRPVAGKEVVCEDCRWIASKAKPSTKVIRKNDQVTYATECDLCGDVERTPFLPKKERLFLCNLCKREADIKARAGKPPGSEKTTGVQPRDVKSSIREEEGTSPPQTGKPPTVDKAEPEPPKEAPIFETHCHGCGKTLTLRFQPSKGESLVCSDCYRSPAEKKKSPGKPIAETSIFYNIECIVCGRKETVNFVPKLGSDAVCTRCFESKRRRF